MNRSKRAMKESPETPATLETVAELAESSEEALSEKEEIDVIQGFQTLGMSLIMDVPDGWMRFVAEHNLFKVCDTLRVARADRASREATEVQS